MQHADSVLNLEYLDLDRPARVFHVRLTIPAPGA